MNNKIDKIKYSIYLFFLVGGVIVRVVDEGGILYAIFGSLITIGILALIIEPMHFIYRKFISKNEK